MFISSNAWYSLIDYRCTNGKSNLNVKGHNNIAKGCMDYMLDNFCDDTDTTASGWYGGQKIGHVKKKHEDRVHLFFSLFVDKPISKSTWYSDTGKLTAYKQFVVSRMEKKDAWLVGTGTLKDKSIPSHYYYYQTRRDNIDNCKLLFKAMFDENNMKDYLTLFMIDKTIKGNPI